MPILSSNLSDRRLEANITEPYHLPHIVTRSNQHAQTATLTDNPTKLIPLPINLQDLWKIITQKEEQIQALTSALKQVKTPQKTKTFQAQQLVLSTQHVAQLHMTNSSLKVQNSLLRQKILLFQQVNSRQYQQAMNLEQQKCSLKQKIFQLQQNFKGEKASRQMKISELTIEITQQRNKNNKLQKQINLLKAIIKELQDNQDSSQQEPRQQQGYRYCQKYSDQITIEQRGQQKNSTQSTQFFGNIFKCQKQSNVSQIPPRCDYCILNKNCSSNPHWPSFSSQTHGNQTHVEDQIVFM